MDFTKILANPPYLGSLGGISKEELWQRNLKNQKIIIFL